jgi:hypothetical protein
MVRAFIWSGSDERILRQICAESFRLFLSLRMSIIYMQLLAVVKLSAVCIDCC